MEAALSPSPPRGGRGVWPSLLENPAQPPSPPTSPSSLRGPHSDTYRLLGVVHLLHRQVLKGYDSSRLLVLQGNQRGGPDQQLEP